MAYLETSIIRSLSSLLARLGTGHCTSVFSFIELVSGILDSDEEFRRRSAAIRALLASPIVMDWEMPEAKLFQAFKYFPAHFSFEEKRVPDLRLILEAINTSRSRDTLAVRFTELPLRFTYKFFRTYDNAIGRGFIEATVFGHKEIRLGYERSVEKGQISQSVSLRDCLDHLRESQPDLNDAFTRFALVQALSQFVAAEVPEADKAQVFDSYDGSLDVYIRALAHSGTEMASRTTRPGRNDAGDLAHLLYVSVGSLFATDDVRLGNLARTARAQVTTSAEMRRA